MGWSLNKEDWVCNKGLELDFDCQKFRFCPALDAIEMDEVYYGGDEPFSCGRFDMLAKKNFMLERLTDKKQIKKWKSKCTAELNKNQQLGLPEFDFIHGLCMKLNSGCTLVDKDSVYDFLEKHMNSS